MTNGVRATAISEQRWSLVDRSGVATLARRHPLTVEGEEIGSFDLVVACVPGGDGYDVTYVERRHAVDQKPLPEVLKAIILRVAGNSASLKVVSSERRTSPDELVTYAAGRVPAALIERLYRCRRALDFGQDGNATARDRDSAGQHRRFAEPSAAFGELQQATRRARRFVEAKTGGLAAAK